MQKHREAKGTEKQLQLDAKEKGNTALGKEQSQPGQENKSKVVLNSSDAFRVQFESSSIPCSRRHSGLHQLSRL